MNLNIEELKRNAVVAGLTREIEDRIHRLTGNAFSGRAANGQYTALWARINDARDLLGEIETLMVELQRNDPSQK